MYDMKINDKSTIFARPFAIALVLISGGIFIVQKEGIDKS